MLTIFIPVYNEEEILSPSVTTVEQYLVGRQIPFEIIVVDNGSTDRTAEIGSALAAKHSWFRFYTLSERGAGRAFILGAQQAQGEYIITLDIDLSSDLIFIDYALDLLKYSDMVVGSKTMGQQRRSLLRLLGSQSYILCTQLLLNLTLSDYSIGSKAYRREWILPALDRLDTWTGYTLELAVFMQRTGKRICQIGINCDDRRKSHFNLLHEGFYRYRHLYRVWKKYRTLPIDLNSRA